MNTNPAYPIAFGDLQGCLKPFQTLLSQINPPLNTSLWFAGDLVNRGPDSLGTLQTLYELAQPKQIVLGNHDVHLIAVAAGIRKAHSKDTFSPLLQSAQAKDLLHWLKKQAFAHYESSYLLVHAGVHPQWDLTLTLELADELHQALQKPNWKNILNDLYALGDIQWHPNLKKIQRMKASLDILTRIRFCSNDGVLNFSDKGAPGSQVAGYFPWFDHSERKTKNIKIVFGHWAALGLYLSDQIIALDSGCVWGNQLSAVRLSPKISKQDIFQVSCSA